MNLNIKVGESWETRGGFIIEMITDIVVTDPMPVKAGTLCWQMNGRYWDDEFEHKMDLAKKIQQ